MKRRARLITGVTIVVFSTAAVAVQFIPKQFTASTQVMVDSRTPRPPVRGSDLEVVQPFSDDIIGTELAVLSSRQSMSEVVKRLNLEQDPYYNPDINPGSFRIWKKTLLEWLTARVGVDLGSAEFGSDTVDELISAVKFVPLPRSRVIEIDVSGKDPNRTAAIANAIADLYVETHLGLRQEMNKEANLFLTKRLQELQIAATGASDAVERYRQEHNLATGASNTLVREQISQLEHELMDARAREGILQTQYDNARLENPQNLSLAVRSETMAHLREQEAQIGNKETEIKARFGPNSPQLQAYSSMLNTIHVQISQEADRVLLSIKNDLAAAKANVALVSDRELAIRQELTDSDAARGHLEVLEAQRLAALNLYNAFLNRSKETDASLLFPNVDVRTVSRATPAVHPSFPRNSIMLPAALVGSLAIGCLCGLLAEARRKTVMSTKELEALFQIPALGVLPAKETKYPTIYRDAVENILNRLYFGRGGKIILITSAMPNEGKTTTARALAEAGAGRGLRVCLIDGDLRTLRTLPAATNDPGLSEVLGGKITTDAALVEAANDLSVISSGLARDNPLRLLSLPAARDMFAKLADAFDLVLIDSPPTMIGGDAWMLTQHADRVVLVVKWAATPTKVIAQALKQLGVSASSDAGKPRCDVVLNMMDRGASAKLDEVDGAIFAATNQYYHMNAA
jgi:capsular exopolysaccharide synthesis family protein